MIKSLFSVAFIWLLVIMFVQMFYHATGKQLVSWIKLFALGALGALVTGVLIFFLVVLF